jgi:3-phenylpropionate/cinnamic acid dioxygenase small subunit
MPDVPSIVGQENAGGSMSSVAIMRGAEFAAACERFLYEEAHLLDHRQFDAWLRCLTPDIEYAVPLRSVHTDGRNEYSTQSFYMKETYDSLEARIARFATDYAWAEEPPSKTRHCVSNVFVEEDMPDEARVRSNLVLLRYTMGQAAPAIVSAERIDVLRKSAGGLQVRRREVFIDSSVLGMQNFTVFL